MKERGGMGFGAMLGCCALFNFIDILFVYKQVCQKYDIVFYFIKNRCLFAKDCFPKSWII
jgi:hypothetical protein